MGEQAVVVKEEEPEDLSLRTREVLHQQIVFVCLCLFICVFVRDPEYLNYLNMRASYV